MEGVVAAILQKLLGRYVAGLEKGNVRLKVWSGRVVLENLCLRQDALSGLVPVHMLSGRIGQLEMVVPWHKLGSLPVTLDLRRVDVLAAPLNEHSWRAEEEEARSWGQKQAALRTRGGELRELLEKLLTHGSLLAEPDDGSLPPGLLGRVLDNVQLTVRRQEIEPTARRTMPPAPVLLRPSSLLPLTKLALVVCVRRGFSALVGCERRGVCAP
jgi:hypothetical protein